MANEFGPRFYPWMGPAFGSVGAFQPKGWDRCVLANSVIPGKVRIGKGGIKLKVDPKKKGGADGANPTFHGLDPQGFDLEIETFSDEDRDALAEILRPIIPRPGVNPTPVSIDHPSLRGINVTAVQIIGVSAVRQTGPMRAVQSIEALHWLPTTDKKATTTPKGAPTRKPPNLRKGSTSPNAPTTQPGFGGPPAQLKR